MKPAADLSRHRRMRLGRQWVFVCLLVCFAVPCAFAEGVAPSQIDAYVQSEIEKGYMPGLAVAVVRNGQVVFAKGYGVASLELPVPVTTSTLFQSASIAKQFTATAIMMLVESGKIGLDDKAGKHLGSVPESWGGITVRHLLTHTSGLGGYPPDFDQRRDYTEEELLRIIQAQPLAFAPGERFQYSNAGYVALGVLIHRVTGMFWGDFVRDRIFKPLNMKTARVMSEAAIIPNRAAGYIVYNGRVVNQPWVAPTLNRTADSSLYLSVDDVAKWDAALYGDTILPRRALQQMWTPATLNDGKAAPYGFGWFVMDANGHRLIEHEGAWQGFNANIARYVDDKLTVIVMANIKSARTQMISHRIAGMYLPSVAPPTFMPIKDEEPEVTQMITRVMRELAAGSATESLFTSDARAAFFPANAKAYGEYLKPLGEPAKVQLVERSRKAGERLYRYEISYMPVTLLVTVTLDNEGRIISLAAVDNY